MFSYLRPHRRSPSTPTSPNPDQHSLDSSLLSPTDHAHPLRTRRSFGHFSRSSAPTLPPFLPPISRVSSPLDAFKNGLTELEEEDVVEDMKTQSIWAYGARSASASRTQSDTSGQADRPLSPGRPQNSRNTDPQNYRPQNGNSMDQSRKSKNDVSKNFSVNHSIDAQDKRKHNGARLPTPPHSTEMVSSTFEAVPESGEKRKTRLNMLNPMSLLARRRTSQAVPQLASPQPSSSSNNKAPVLYDPSIRGTKVHDFSAPRTRRNVSHNDLSSLKNGRPYDSPRGTEERPWSGGNHTPVFKEDFEEEQYPAAGPHVRKANDFTDLEVPKPPYARESMRSANHNKTEVPNEKLDLGPTVAEMKSSRKSSPPPLPLLPTTEEEEIPLSPTSISKSQNAPDGSPKRNKSPSQKRRSRAISEVSSGDLATLHGLPKHMKSTSSRFSFDMIGAAKQEKLLEDRHRQKAAERKANSPAEDDYENEGEFDDFDYDGMMDDDGLEERIPGVNADYEEDELGDDVGALVGNVAGFTFHSMATGTPALSSPMSPYSAATLPTPRDASGEIIGFAYSKESPGIHQDAQLPISPNLATSPVEGRAIAPAGANIHGLGLLGVDYGSHDAKPFAKDAEDIDLPTNFPAPPVTEDDDDLYFDDGIIDSIPEEAPTKTFDESVFDLDDTDVYGRPLKPTQSFKYGEQSERKSTDESAESTTTHEPEASVEPSSPEAEINTGGKPILEIDTRAPPSRQTLSPLADNVLAPHPSISELRSTTDPEKSDISRPSNDLTHDSLAAYQSALAAAAFKAAANGKFNRNSTPTTATFDDREEMLDQPGLVPDSGRQSEELFSPSYDVTYDDFNYDDEMDDDDIIAAANAEALAYDCDGFYGQEFGFYSAPLPSAGGSNEYIHGMGGYFGPRGTDGIMRSMSGRIAMREPNLTPITERSEYSNRNSIMSLQLQGFDRQSLTSPGLAQLAMMSPYDEENMSLGALMKLRRGAWGGSQASLHSTGSDGSPKSVNGEGEMRTSSPLGNIHPWQSTNGGGGRTRRNSNLSLQSDRESTSAPPSPVLMMAAPQHKKPRRLSQETKSPILERVDIPSTEKNEGRRKGHGKTASADSISYMKEEDGNGWVLERRRTGETGEREMVGREVVCGGRI